MKKLFIPAVFVLGINLLPAQEILTFEQLAPRLSTQSDTVFVVNFWATWCGPCVAELPHFEKLQEQNKDQKFKLLLVSLDNKNVVATKVTPFIQKKNLTAEVVVLAEKDPNKWVDKVDESWTGSIPATLIFNNSQKAFYEKQFESFEELKAAFTPLTTPSK